VVLLSEISHVLYAARSAGKIIAAIKAAHRIEGQELVVTASIGIGVYPLDGTDVQTLLRCADAAMYQAKKNGRNNYWFFSEKMNRGAATRRSAPHLARATRS
jgi:diguanylate cyclase